MPKRNQKGKFVKSSQSDQNRNPWRGTINLISPQLVTTIGRPVIIPIAYKDHIYVDRVVSDVVHEETVTTNDMITSKSE